MPRVVVTVTGIIYALVGLALAGGGAWLARLGGSPYYLIAGLGILITGGLLITRRRAALWVYRRLTDRYPGVGGERDRL